MSTPFIRLQDVRVTLGGTEILRGVNAELERGCINALIGLNGSGKTTLLKALLKEIPYRGEIQFFCGHDHSRRSPKHIGYVPQKLNIDAKLPLTVRDLMGLALQSLPIFLGISRRTDQTILKLLARVFQRPTLMLHKPVENLSGGELQRILMALALHPEPELLLLDEPAAGIDFQDQEEFYELIARLNEESKVTMVLVSHDLSIVNQHAHQVLCLKDGRVECSGRPEEILQGDKLHETYGTGAGIYRHSHSESHVIRPDAPKPRKLSSG
ncbi:MAG: metal ABC transporter ATP-binding protein [Gemmataceae bacterium]